MEEEFVPIKPIYYIHKYCPNCHKSKGFDFISLDGDKMYQWYKPIHMVRCKNCGKTYTPYWIPSTAKDEKGNPITTYIPTVGYNDKSLSSDILFYMEEHNDINTWFRRQ